MPDLLINTLEPGQEVTITSTDGTATLTQKTTVANVTTSTDLNLVKKLRMANSKKNCCILDPVHEEDLMINFVSDKVIKSVIIVIDDKPYIWENINIVNLFLPFYGSVHCALTGKSARPYNRREHFRVWLGAEGIVKLPNVADILPITIKDLSESGIGFSIVDLHGITEGMRLEVDFADVSTGAKFSLLAHVVRVVQQDNGKYTVGCTLNVKSSNIAKFIHAKQQENMRRSQENKKKSNSTKAPTKK